MKINNQEIEQDISLFIENRENIKQQYISLSIFGSLNLFKTIEQCVTTLNQNYTIQDTVSLSTLNDDRVSIINGLLSAYKCFNDTFDEIYSFSHFKKHLSKSNMHFIMETESHPAIDNLNRKRDRLDTFPFYDLNEDDCILLQKEDSLIVLNSCGVSFIYQENDLAITISQNVITILSGDKRATFCSATIKKESSEITGIAAHTCSKTDSDLAIVIYLSKNYQIGLFNKIVDIDGCKTSLICVEKDKLYGGLSKPDSMINIIKSGDPILFALLMHKEIDLQEFEFSELPYSKIVNIG